MCKSLGYGYGFGYIHGIECFDFLWLENLRVSFSCQWKQIAAKIELCVNSWGFFTSWFVSYSFHLCHHVIDPPFRPKIRWSLIFVPNIADTCWDGFGFLDLCWQMLQLYLVPFSPSNPYHPGYVSISGYIFKTAPLKSIPMKQNWFVHTEWETGVERGDRRGWNQRLIEPLLSRK